MIENIVYYQVVLPGGKGINVDRAVGLIHGWDDKKIHRLTCHFHAEGKSIPENSISGGTVQLHYPMRTYAVVLNVFRNESPLTVMYDETTTEGQITTQHELVGKRDLATNEFDESSDVIYRRFKN